MGPGEASEMMAYGLVYVCLAALTLFVGTCWALFPPAAGGQGRYGVRGPRDVDAFARENGYSWDWAISMPIYGSDDELNQVQREYSLRRVIERLAGAEVETRTCMARGGGAVVLKLRCRVSRLIRQAVASGYRLELDESALEDRCRQGAKKASGEWIWRPLELAYDRRFCAAYFPYAHCFAAYDEREELRGLWRTDGEQVLRGVDRARLLLEIVQAPAANDGAGLALSKLVREGAILRSCGLHEYFDLRELAYRWRGLSLARTAFAQPLDDIRGYFGEAIALYFALAAKIATWQMLLAAMGLAAWASDLGGDRHRSVSTAFGVAATSWATGLARSWRADEARSALEWGTIVRDGDDQDDDAERAEYRESKRGTLIDSPITGKPGGYFYVPEPARYDLAIAGLFAATSCVGIVASGVAVEWGLKDCCSPKKGGTEVVFALLEALRIVATRRIARRAAARLVDLCNLRTERAYENARASACLGLDALNATAALGYVAFIRPFMPQSCSFDDNCLRELRVLLAVEFAARTFLFDLGVRVVARYARRPDELTALSDDPGGYDEQPFLETSLLTALDRLGHVACFATAFPPLAALATSTDVATLRIDALYLATTPTRPRPDKAADLGAYGSAVAAIPVLAAITNAALVVYTGRFFDLALDRTATPNTKPVLRLIIFLVLEHVLLGFHLILSLLVGDAATKDVDTQIKRHAFILSKVFANVADDDDDPDRHDSFLATLDTSKPFVPNLTIQANDEDWTPIQGSIGGGTLFW
ncbi:hypothetical protein CTAYLR_003729 [Chrysophaeum taylorii]|uniref:Anoctamin transmembrane domain-containing protein n=1 Tax=Chrysophaeum taylorii TaxID=2483200 RepID=A0AAD7XPT9_9STRA|nr:hypothetical protein CTAYLR_003729 [Chrysophaeum taylorii]